MVITTPLNVPPYWQDYDEKKDFYQIIFQPGVSVQTRELNNLQAMFQKQIERFGDNIFTSGTIVSGCNFSFLNPFPYIKIKDLDYAGTPTIPYRYVNYNAINETTGLIAWVINYADGFETSDPNLKTLYLSYQNTGNGTVNTLAFSAGDVLKIYDPVMNGVENINILNGGIGFSNTDQLLAISPITVTVASGSLSNGDYLINNQGANVQIIALDSTTYASSNQTIVSIKPRAADLANSAANSSFWSFLIGQSLTNPANTISATVQQVIGAGFVGTIITDGVGTILSTTILNKGVKYTPVAPYMTMRSVNNTTGYVSLNLLAQNYFAKIVVASTPNSVGDGYAFGVTEGVVYQKGFFLRVVPQQIVVSKYNTTPDNVAVGFITSEQIVNKNIDSSLLDNVDNTQNQQAPGADRLKLIPQLQLDTSQQAAANAEFLTIAEWKEGRPYKQNQATIYSTIGDEMAQRTEEQSGDFVIDPFLVTTRSPLDTTEEGEFFNIVIDPGKAYLDGYRVSTLSNYNINDEKGTDLQQVNSHIISLNYGNYLIINNVGGTFQFNTGDTVDLYDTAQKYLATPSLITSQDLSPPGSKIGTANIRSLLRLDVSEPGMAGSTYKLYVFNILMNNGKNFRDVKSVYYNGTLKGVGDIVTVKDPTTSKNICVLNNPNFDSLVFNIGVDTLMNSNAAIYTYRTIDQTVTVSNGNVSNATLVKDISANINETYPYTGALNSSQMPDLYVVPTSGELIFKTALTGTVTAATTTANIVGSSTTFLTDLAVGDWIYVSSNSTGGADLHQVQTVVNNIFCTVEANIAYANAVAKIFRVFPQNVPIPFGFRSGLNANVNVNQNILTLDFGTPFTFSGTKTVSLATNIIRTGVTQSTKTPNRQKFVLLCTSNNTGGINGPWCLGVPDVFRLRSIHVGNSTVDNTGPNQINSFYVDHNQNGDFYDLSFLYIQNQASLTLTSNTYLLVKFDYFTSSGVGFYDTVSYTQSSNLAQIFIQDSKPLSNLASVVNSFEVPELFLNDGTEIDLLNQMDFRPYAANTVAPSSVYSTAPLNPGSNTVLSTTGEKKFPLPDSVFISNIQYYLGRIDSVFVDKNANFSVISGPPAIQNLTRPSTPTGLLKIIDVVIPPYPNLPTYYSVWLDQILNTRIMNQKFLTTRITKKTIAVPPSANNVLPYNQPRVYTMADIGNMDRRLKDVEYEVSLSALEAGVANQFIPSSVDPTMNRFKFGFFVDDFTTSLYSDLTNPQYWALKEGPDIVPPKMTWDVSLPPASPPWVESKIIGQDLATVGSIADPLGLGPICALNLANTVAYRQVFRNASDILLSSNASGTVDVVNLTFASNTTIFETINYVDTPLNQWLQTHSYTQYKNLNIQYVDQQGKPSGSIAQLANSFTQAVASLAGAETVDFGFIINGINFTANVGQPDTIPTDVYNYLINIVNQASMNITKTVPSGGTFVNTIYYPPVVLYFYNYDQPSLIQIYQNNTLIADSSTAVVLTADDKNLLTGPGGDSWFNDFTQFFMKDFVEVGGGYVTYAGKITFNYNPNNGANFTIKTTSPQSIRWRWVLAYPIDGKSVGCVPPNPVYTSTPTFSAQYTNEATTSWCGNSTDVTPGSISILSGYTETWNPIPIPVPTTSVVPFDITKDWFVGSTSAPTGPQLT